MTTINERVPIRSREYDTAEDDVIVDWYAAAEGAKRAVGGWAPQRGDNRPGDTTSPACFGYTCTEVETDKRDRGEAMLVVTWRRPKRLDTDANLTEIRRTPGYGRTGNTIVPRGTRVWITPDAQAETTVNVSLPPYTLWPGDAGIGSRQLVDVQIERNWRKGLARITGVYGVPSWNWGGVSTPGKGILAIRIGGEQRTLKYDLDGDPIEAEGWDATAKQKFRWVLYRGSNVTLSGTCTLVLRVVLINPSVAAIMGLVGTYNAAACPNIGGAGAKTLKLLPSTMEPVPGYTGYWTVDFLFAYDPAGWDKACKAERENYKVVEVAVVDEDGTATGGTSRTGVWVPDAATIADRVVCEAGNFATLDQYLAP